MTDEQQKPPAESTDGTGSATGTTQAAARTFTQQELDRFLSEARKEERKKIPADYDDLKSKLADFERGQMTEIERIKKEADDERSKRLQLEADAKQVRLENLRLRVAKAKTLPDEWIDRLRGETEEDMLKDADAILASIQKVAAEQAAPTKPRPMDGASRNGQGKGGPFTDELMERAKRRFVR